MKAILFTLLFLSVTCQAQQNDQSPATYQLNAIPQTPLAITGFQVSGILVGHNIRLEWKTTSEHNTSHFNIERSRDGAKFQYAGTTLAAGMSTAERKYSFTDFFASPGNNYYRIASVDNNEDIAYSNVVVVRLNKNNNEIVLYPNPASDKVHIMVADDEGRDINLITINGAILKRHTLAEGSNEFIMDVKDLSEGIYKVNIINKENKEVESHWLIIRS